MHRATVGAGTRHRCQTGFSLLEVMIAVLVIAVGLLGIAALQITSNVYSESSLHRSQAAMLARELVERMRVNVDEAKAGSYSGGLTNSGPDCADPSADCSTTDLKDYDLLVWSDRVRAMLPGPPAAVITTSTVDDLATITIQLTWSERRSSGRTTPGSADSVSETFTFQLYGVGL